MFPTREWPHLEVYVVELTIRLTASYWSRVTLPLFERQIPVLEAFMDRWVLSAMRKCVRFRGYQ